MLPRCIPSATAAAAAVAPALVVGPWGNAGLWRVRVVLPDHNAVLLLSEIGHAVRDWGAPAGKRGSFYSCLLVSRNPAIG